jgi:hypothetical protein
MRWKLVPVEPTPEMVEAAKDNRASQPQGTLPGSAMRQMFEAMISVAPTPPEVEPVAEVSVREGRVSVHGYKLIGLPDGTKLYASPPPADDELRKAAEDVLEVLLRRWVDDGVTLSIVEKAKINALRIELNKFK